MDDLDLDLNPTQKAQLQTVADLLLDIYRTLARMRYLDPEWIHPGPHNIEALLPKCRELELEPSIIYLYSILPYIEPVVTNRVDFFGGSYFADFRTEGDVEDSRDPFFSDESDQAMRPWMTPLSKLGNHQSCIIYSAKKHRIWMIDQEIWDTTDPKLTGGFEEGPDDYDSDSDIGEQGISDDVTRSVSEEGVDEGGKEGSAGKRGSDTEEGAKRGEADSSGATIPDDESKTKANSPYSEGDYDDIPSRPADEVLRDINRWYHELRVMPGGGENSGTEWMPKISRPLYRKHGWPRDDFNGDTFIQDILRADAARTAKWSVKAHQSEKDKSSGSQAYNDAPVHQKMCEEIRSATTVNEEWLACWKLWEVERAKARTQERQREAEAEAKRLFPDGVGQRPEDLPLWEAEQLRQWCEEKQENLERMQEDAERLQLSDPASAVAFQIKLRCVKDEAAICQGAYKAAKADVERLCPGRSAATVSGIQCLGMESSVTVQQKIRGYTRQNKYSERELEVIQEWAAQLPAGADQARNMAYEEIQMHGSWIESNKQAQTVLEQEKRRFHHDDIQ